MDKNMKIYGICALLTIGAWAVFSYFALGY